MLKLLTLLAWLAHAAIAIDTTPPQLTAFTVSPTTINSTSVPTRVIIDFTIVDDGSGFQSIEFTFASPHYPVNGVLISTSTGSNGLKSFKGSTGVTFPAGSEAGDWPIGIVMKDMAGNTRILRPADLAGLKFSDHVTVLGPSSVGTLSFSPAWLEFIYTLRGSAPPPQTISVNSTLSGIDFRVDVGTSIGSWLAATPLTGTANTTVSVAVDPRGLDTGTYIGKLTFTSARASNSPIAFPVSLTIASDNAPIISGAAMNGASFKTGIAPSSWVSVMGQNLATTTRIWGASDIVNSLLPTSLSGVSVYINNKPAAVYFISPAQLNVQAPDDTATGSVSVIVNTPTGRATGTAMLSQFSPALFTINGTYVAAVFPDGAYVGNPNAQGPAFKPVRPGDVVMLFGTGFGPTDPPRPAGKIIDTAPITTEFTITIGGMPAKCLYAGVVGAGIYQFNVEIPLLGSGDAPILIHIAGLDTQSGVMIPVKN